MSVRARVATGLAVCSAIWLGPGSLPAHATAEHTMIFALGEPTPPGIPAGFDLRAVGEARIRGSEVVLSGLTTGSEAVGLRWNAADGFEPIVFPGDDLPDGTEAVGFPILGGSSESDRTPHLVADGEGVFNAFLSLSPVRDGLWRRRPDGSLESIMVEGGALPGGGGSFGELGQFATSQSGRVAFIVSTTSVWLDDLGSDPVVIASFGDPVPGASGTVEVVFDVRTNDAGGAVVSMARDAGSLDSLVRWTGSALESVVHVGDPFPLFDAGGEAAVITSLLNQGASQKPVIDELGRVVHFVRTLRSPSGHVDSGLVRTGAPGSHTVIARQAQSAPGAGESFQSFDQPRTDGVLDPVVDATGRVTFGQLLNSGRAGVWSFDTDGVLRPVLVEGGALEGLSGVSHGPAFGDAYRYTTNDLGDVLALLELSGSGVTSANDLAVAFVPVGGDPRILVREGDSLTVAPGDDRVVLSAFLVGNTNVLFNVRPDHFEGLGGLSNTRESVVSLAFASGGATFHFSNPLKESTSVAGGGAATASLLGGDTAPGGVEAGFDDTGGGTLTGEWIPVAPDETLDDLAEDPGAIDFALASSPVYAWDIDYDGSFSGCPSAAFPSCVELTLAYDDATLDEPESDLEVYHHVPVTMGCTLSVDCGWLLLPKLDQDLVADTITVATDGFSQFMLGGAPLPGLVWTFSGVAQGGLVRFTVGGVFLTVATSAGETASDVAQAVAGAINASADLSALGITAAANGGRVTSPGALTTHQVDDPGLTSTTGTGPEGVPAIGWAWLAFATMGLAAVAGRRLRARS